MSQDYPYVQSKTEIANFICDNCKQQIANGFELEWRVDWFQGNCEFEKLCEPCMTKETQRVKREKDEQNRLAQIRHNNWERQMKPKWERLERLLTENNIEVKKYPNTGQWTFNNIIDWWTTTGTAIHRKTRKQYNFSVEKPEFIIKSIFKS